MYLSSVQFDQPLHVSKKGTDLPFDRVKWHFEYNKETLVLETAHGFDEWSTSLTLQFRILFPKGEALFYDYYQALKNHKILKHHPPSIKWTFLPNQEKPDKSLLSWTLNKTQDFKSIDITKLNQYISPSLVACVSMLLGALELRHEDFFVHPMKKKNNFSDLKVHFLHITCKEDLKIDFKKRNQEKFFLPNEGEISWRIKDANKPGEIYEIDTIRDTKTKTINFKYKAHSHNHFHNETAEQKTFQTWTAPNLEFVNFINDNNPVNSKDKSLLPIPEILKVLEVLKQHWNIRTDEYIVDPYPVRYVATTATPNFLKRMEHPKSLNTHSTRSSKHSTRTQTRTRTHTTRSRTKQKKKQENALDKLAPEKGLAWLKKIKRHFDKINKEKSRHVLPPYIDPKWFSLKQAEDARLKLLRTWARQSQKLPIQGNWFPRIVYACMQLFGLGGKANVNSATKKFSCWCTASIGILSDEDYTDLCRSLNWLIVLNS